MIMNQMIAGAKTVTGEIALSNSAFLEVTGLPFRPKGIMAALYLGNVASTLITWYLADQNTGVSLGKTDTGSTSYKLRDAILTITSNSIKISDATSDVGPKKFYGTYQYIIWG